MEKLFFFFFFKSNLYSRRGSSYMQRSNRTERHLILSCIFAGAQTASQLSESLSKYKKNPEMSGFSTFLQVCVLMLVLGQWVEQTKGTSTYTVRNT